MGRRKHGEASSELLDHVLGDKCPLDPEGHVVVDLQQKDVPADTLPKGVSGVVYTPAAAPVSSTGKVRRGRGCDDETYKQYPTLHRMLPRAYSVLEVKTHEGEVDRAIVQGFYKFSAAASVDEDTDVACSALLAPELLATAGRAIVTEKVNGKTAVMTMFKIRGVKYLFGGTKGAHRLVPLEDAWSFIVKAGMTISSPMVADVFKLFLEQLDAMTPKHREELLSLMCGSRDLLSGADADSKEAADDATRCGFTLCGEYLDGKHLIPVEGGKTSIVWFGLMVNTGRISAEATLCDDMVASATKFQAWGLPCVPFRVVSPDELLEMRPTLRLGTLKEGYVIHWQRRLDDGSWVTIAVEKYKVWWYVVIRCLREFMRNSGGTAVGCEERWATRLTTRNADYMKFDDATLRAWLQVTTAFLQWFVSKGKNSQILGITGDDGVGMGNIWAEFVEDVHPDMSFAGVCKF